MFFAKIHTAVVAYSYFSTLDILFRHSYDFHGFLSSRNKIKGQHPKLGHDHFL
jgi:hypothetical protein